MTRRNKKIMWWSGGAAIATLILLYVFCPPFQRWSNHLLGKNEKELPKPNNVTNNEYEYGRPVEELDVETLDIPKDSLLDSLLMADSIMGAAQVKPIDGPPPAHVEGFGEEPLPPMPSPKDVPGRTKEDLQEVTPSPAGELEQHVSEYAAVNNKIKSCRMSYNRLLGVYREFAKTPTAALQEQGLKLKENLLNELTQLMKLSQSKNDDAGMEEAADLRREVNKMQF